MILIIGTAVVAIGGGLSWFIHQRAAAKVDVLASRVSEADVDAFLKDVKISFPEHKRGVRRAGPGGGGPVGVAGRAEDFNNKMDLGDVSQEGGDALLDEGVIDRVNARQLPTAGSLHYGQGRLDHCGRLRGSAHRTGQGGAGQ